MAWAQTIARRADAVAQGWARGMLFWKKAEKWHEVRWFSGPRDIYLAIQFAGDDPAPGSPPVLRLQSKDPEAAAAQPAIDERDLVEVINRAVAEYNKLNLCGLKVAGVKYRAKGGATVADHGAAARKLLNLL